MKNQNLFFPIILDGDAFRRFAVFDTFRRKGSWKSPALFAAVLFGCALICFLAAGRVDGAVFLGSILTLVAFGLPAVYIRSFFASVSRQIQKLGLSSPQHVYSVELTKEADGILCFRPDQTSSCERFFWDQASGAWRTDTAVYLYVTDRRALLIPNGSGSAAPETLWSFLTERLPADRLHDCRKKH